MDIRKLQRAIVNGLEDVKAQNIVVYNTEALSPLFERVIIASGTSNRQTKALASSVRETVKKRGLPVLRTEGEDNGEWIIVDCGAAVAHIMQPAIRQYYKLEEIWGEKPVRLRNAAPLSRSSAAAPAAKKAAAAAPAAKKAATAARKTATASTAAKKAPAGKAPARKAVATPAAPAKRAPAKKAVAGKTAAVKSAAGKPAPRRKPA